ncbi:DUF748 domain-containing protein [Rubinisphaera margarita]|uniref:DUF748 domain-containing protein n=1 Tax=Rubinisphaera margarita TaxID=2909586 RepID=UPI001EE7DE31|nr:hypothetical protein [Rubinisphaera margarita]MCG6155109.1 hypothetical protein [Rubinisphaera margarita]
MVQVNIERHNWSDNDTVEKDEPRRRPRWKRWLIGTAVLLVCCLVGVVALLPQILSSESVKKQIADSLMREFNGKLTIGDADLAWWRPAQLSKVTVQDDSGDPLATIGSAEVNTPLWKMFWPSSAPLELKITRPEFVYEINTYGQTNWDRVFGRSDEKGPWKWPEMKHGGQPLRIRIVDGKVTVRDNVSERTIETENIEIQLEKSTRLLAGQLTGDTLFSSPSQKRAPAGRVEADFQLAMADGKVTAGDVEGKIEKTPLELIQPWLNQAVPHLHLTAANTDGKFATKWSGSLKEGFKLAFEGTLSATDLLMRSTEWLPDQELTSTSVTGTVSIDNTLPTAAGKFDIDCLLENCVVSPFRESENEPAEPVPAEDLFAPLSADEREDAEPESEPVELGRVRLVSTGVIETSKRNLELTRFDFSTDPWQMEMAGTIADWVLDPVVDIEGTSQGNIHPLLCIAFPGIRQAIEVDQLAPDEFAIHGRIRTAPPEQPEGAEGEPIDSTAPAPLTSSAKASPFDEAEEEREPTNKELPLSAVALWSWGELSSYGVDSKNGELWTKLSEETLKIVPVEVLIGKNGYYKGVSHIHLKPGERTFVMEPGVILENVEFTRGMCRSWLKYVSPLFANATELEGRFSLEMKSFELDLDTGEPKSLRGILKVDHCRLGPGPMVQQATAPILGVGGLVGRDIDTSLLEGGAKWLEIPKQDVEFTRRDDRIYHDQLLFRRGDINVTSGGSVGLDQTLDLTIRIPLNLLQDQTGPLAQFLRSQPLVIRIAGTMDNPQITGGDLRNYGAGAVNSLLQGILERRRNRQNR